jgi:hypothetical protein
LTNFPTFYDLFTMSILIDIKKWNEAIKKGSDDKKLTKLTQGRKIKKSKK